MPLSLVFFCPRPARTPDRVAAWFCGCLVFLAGATCQAQADGGSAQAGHEAVPPLSLTNSAAEDEFIAGPAYSDYRLTLESGRRQEILGPLFS
ncbi:MAG TPA: hypothetical protein VN765_07530, partial [Candidatus Acidoferrum sp.]|nr:hypothetical protein [Candidatus Acidoferrum sp.]